jgi:hypothetical protein
MLLVAYVIFALLASLPAMISLMAVLLGVYGAVLIARGQVMAGALVLASGGCCALLILGPERFVPGARPLRALRQANARRVRATATLMQMAAAEQAKRDATNAVGDAGPP